jgi:hypothetical protein
MSSTLDGRMKDAQMLGMDEAHRDSPQMPETQHHQQHAFYEDQCNDGPALRPCPLCHNSGLLSYPQKTPLDHRCALMLRIFASLGKCPIAALRALISSGSKSSSYGLPGQCYPKSQALVHPLKDCHGRRRIVDLKVVIVTELVIAPRNGRMKAGAALSGQNLWFRHDAVFIPMGCSGFSSQYCE